MRSSPLFIWAGRQPWLSEDRTRAWNGTLKVEREDPGGFERGERGLWISRVDGRFGGLGRVHFKRSRHFAPTGLQSQHRNSGSGQGHARTTTDLVLSTMYSRTQESRSRLNTPTITLLPLSSILHCSRSFAFVPHLRICHRFAGGHRVRRHPRCTIGRSRPTKTHSESPPVECHPQAHSMSTKCPVPQH